MDGWMDGWVGGWVDGRAGGRAGGHTHARTHTHTHTHTHPGVNDANFGLGCRAPFPAFISSRPSGLITDDSVKSCFRFRFQRIFKNANGFHSNRDEQ